MAGLYIHVPFCATRCVYCGFYSTTQLSLRHDYVLAVCRELELRRGYLGDEPLRTVYIGGGTPSQLPAGDLGKLLDAARSLPGDVTEVTVECNPDDVTPTLSHALRGMGVNRVSMGVQSFSDSRLRFLRRRHTSAAAIAAVGTLRDAGIDNISIDLMSGFPGQSIDDWDSDLSQALNLGVRHISSYSLMYEEGTPLYKALESGAIEPLDDDLSLAMYDLMVSRLTEAGYEHYEISNFAQPGYRSRHNSSYWDGTPYIGLGAGAHSYDCRSRQWNVSDLVGYISAVNAGQVPAEREALDAATMVNDLITTALRTHEGLDIPMTASRHGSAYADQILTAADRYIRSGLLTYHDGHLRLTLAGIHISDMIMSDLMII